MTVISTPWTGATTSYGPDYKEQVRGRGLF